MFFRVENIALTKSLAFTVRKVPVIPSNYLGQN